MGERFVGQSAPCDPRRPCGDRIADSMSLTTSHRRSAGLAGSLRNGGLRKLYAAEIVSGAGDGVFWVALVVFLAEQERFGLWLTLAVIARLAPRALLSLPAGSLVDRSRQRRLLVSVEGARAVLMALLAVVVAVDGPPAVALVVVVVSYSVASPTRPALSAIVPVIAGERHLAVANAVLSTVRQIMTFIGPLLGVAVVAWSPVAGFVLNAATFALSGLLIALVRGIPDHSTPNPASGGGRRRLGGSFVDGIRTVAGLPALTSLVGLIGVMSFVRGSEMVLHVFVVRDLLDEDVGIIGLLGGAVGLGALVVMPVAARAAGSDAPVRPILLAVVVTALATAALALIEETLWACAVLVLVGVGMVVFEVVIVVMLQRVTPAFMLGRVFGAVNGASNTGKLVGAVVAPGLVAVVGLRWSLVVVAVAVLLGGLLAVKPLVVVGRQAAARRRDLQPRVTVLEALGIFEGASTSAIERIAASVDERSVPAGNTVIHEGDAADDLYVTISGLLDVSVSGRHLDVLRDGDWFGEIGLLDHRPRTATVTTIDPCVLWRIPGDVFLSALEDAGAPPSALVDGMADRLAAHR